MKTKEFGLLVLLTGLCLSFAFVGAYFQKTIGQTKQSKRANTKVYHTTTYRYIPVNLPVIQANSLEINPVVTGDSIPPFTLKASADTSFVEKGVTVKVHADYSYPANQFKILADFNIPVDSVTTVITKYVNNPSPILRPIVGASIYNSTDSNIFGLKAGVSIKDKVDVLFGICTDKSKGIEIGYRL